MIKNRGKALVISTFKSIIMTRAAGQREYLQALSQHKITLAAGPLVAGKTYLAIAQAANQLLQVVMGEIVLAVLHMPRLGNIWAFLLEILRDKIAPYLCSLYDVLRNRSVNQWSTLAVLKRSP